METRDDHFIRLPTKLHEALCRTRIKGEARMVLDVIIRQTIGWQKSADWITLSQFEALTGLRKNAICRAIGHLLMMKVIHKKVKDGKAFYSVEEKNACWIPLPKKRRGHKSVNDHSHKSEAQFSNTGHTIETVPKETETTKTVVLAAASTTEPKAEIVDPMEDEYRRFLKGVSQILKEEKKFTLKGFKKYCARRRNFNLERLCAAFENLEREPDRWKIENNAFRPMQWWLKSDEYIEELEHVHLKKVKGQGLQAAII